MRRPLVIVPLVFSAFASASLAAQPKASVVCVAPIPAAPPERISPGQNCNPDTLSIGFDRREAVPWPKEDWMKFEDLDPAIRHLVVLTSDGKRIQSFWFRFSDYRSDALCLSFDGYQGIQLQKSTPRCKCK
jgi:hypothetical protein